MKAIVILILLLVVLGVVYAGSGMVDVAASKPENSLIASLLTKVSDASITAHSKNITAPALGDPAQVQEGFQRYRMCAGCHGAPGRPRTGMAKGLNPEPPDFTERTDLSAAELFWVTKNGIKMTGMPAWGETLKDDEIWAIVAFVQKLPDVDSTQWRRRSMAAGDNWGAGRPTGPGGPPPGRP